MNKEQRRDYAKKHYAENKEKYQERNRATRKALRDKIKEYKESNPCTDCNNYYPSCVMDFDHVNPQDKKNRHCRISSLVTSGEKECLKRLKNATWYVPTAIAFVHGCEARIAPIGRAADCLSDGSRFEPGYGRHIRRAGRAAECSGLLTRRV